jgi:hypothetical protein
VNLAALLFDVARRQPEAPAVSDGFHAWSYREFARRISSTRSPLQWRRYSRAARSIDFWLLTLSFGICGFSISTAPWPARRSIQTTALRQHSASG